MVNLECGLDCEGVSVSIEEGEKSLSSCELQTDKKGLLKLYQLAATPARFVI